MHVIIVNYYRPMNNEYGATLSSWGGDADLELGGPDASVRVTEEGDECGAQDVVFGVVLRAAVVSQLDHPVVVGQPVVSLTQAPRVGAVQGREGEDERWTKMKRGLQDK